MLPTEKSYLSYLFVILLCIVLDIARIPLITYYPTVWITTVIEKMHLISIITVFLSLLNYTVTDLRGHNHKFGLKIFQEYLVLFFITCATILYLPVEFKSSDEYLNDFAFSKGPAVALTYFVGFISLIIGFESVYKFRKHLRNRRTISISIALAFFLIATIIQYCIPKLLVISFALSLGALFIFILYENPDSKLDRSYSIYSSMYLKKIISRYFKLNQKFYTIAIYLDSYSEKVADQKIRLEIVNFIKENRGVYCFNNNNDGVVLLLKDKDLFLTCCDKIKERFEKPWGEDQRILSPWIICIRDTRYIENYENFEYLVNDTINNLEKSQKFISLTANEIKAILRKQEIEKKIVEAIEKDWIKVFYQPLYSIKDKKFTTAEALVRIIDDEGNILPPFEFIPIAEENGSILKIGEIVFSKVCALLKTNVLQQYGLEYIEVNLSIEQCAHTELASTFIKIMEEYDIGPSSINLEITETASLKAKKTLLQNMNVLMQYGTSFSLDDFGTGNSNLNYIIEMPVEIVKFDRSVTQNSFVDAKYKFVVQSAVKMIKDMGLKIVSEGVETKEQFEKISQFADYIQGYYFSKPLPTDEFIEYIKKNNSNNFQEI
jgi:EAL domain-containing protein (putative c-di-GMP-specific phosphodiesterase class I)